MALTDAGNDIGFPILSTLVLLPLAVAVALAFIRSDMRAYRAALAGAVVELLLACVLVLRFVGDVEDVQFMERSSPLPGVGFAYQLGVDGISVLFVPIIALLTVLVVAYAEYAVDAGARRYLIAVLALEATLVGAFVSLDLMLFWFFFVAELVPSYFLITRFGTGALRRRAALEYVGFMLAGAALMLGAFLLLGINHARAAGGGGVSFDYLELLAVPLSAELQTVVFFLLFLGFAVKAPIFPFHTWLPKVLEHGPVVGMSVFLVGIKLGTYGFLRFMIPLAPDAARQWLWLLAVLGALSIAYAALIALVQTNLRRLLAFASVSHMGAVLLGLSALNFHGFQGGLLQMINLGIAGAGLFFVGGFLHTRVGPPELSSMGGLVHSVPLLSATFLVIALATVGLPGTGGFNGEHLILIGAYERSWAMALAAGAGTVLTAAYLLWYFQRAFLGPHQRGSSPGGLADLRNRELLITLALAGMIFWIGLASGPFLRHMNGTLRWLEQRVAAVSVMAPQPVPAQLGVALRGPS